MISFRKIASVLASTVMIGSTIALAAAAYPAPFVQGGNANVAEVYGSAPGAAVDLAAVVEINTKLQAELAKQTATSGATTGASATGGDAVNVATSSQLLYMGGKLNVARSVITKTEMPSLLADGIAYDNTGTSYDYQQNIQLTNGSSITFGTSGESIDPMIYLDMTTTPGNFYNYTLTVKSINVSSADVIGTAEFNILGQKFTVGSGSTNSTLYLYGAGTEVTVTGGEEKKVTLNGVEHTIKLVTTSGTTGSIEVDGVRKTVSKGNSYKFAGSFEVYIKDITIPQVAGDPRDIQLLLGSSSLILGNGEIKVGADSKIVDNAKSYVTADGVGTITKVVVSQAAADSSGDYIKAGGTYTDRIFNNLKVSFAGVNPAIDSAARDAITVTGSSLGATVKLTTYGASTAGEKTLQYALDNDNTADSNLTFVNTAYRSLDSNGAGVIHVVEAESMKKDDLILVNAGDEGKILKLTSLPSNSDSDNEVVFTDYLTGEQYKFKTGTGSTATATIAGQSYFVAVNNSASLADTSRIANITWGSGAAAGSAGSQTTVSPRIKLKNGEWFTILSSTTLTNGTTYILPGKYSLSDYESGGVLSLPFNAAANASATTFGTSAEYGIVNYTMSYNASVGTSATLSGVSADDSTVNCNFNAARGPAILIYEKKTNDDTNGNAICIPLTTEGSGTITPAIGQPVFTDGVGAFKQLNSDTDKSQAVDKFGAFVQKNNANENIVSVTIPSDQMIADVLFTATGTTVAAGSSSAGTVKELGAPFVTDSEVSSVSTSNLIVIGGSCVNTVAAQLLGSSAPLCGAAFTAKTGVNAGEFLIQSFASPYSTGKVATLVAGFSAQDTVNAAKYFTTQSVDTTAGKAYKGTSATEATLVTTTA